MSHKPPFVAQETTVPDTHDRASMAACQRCLDNKTVSGFDGIQLPCSHCDPEAAAACLASVYRAWSKVRTALNALQPRWVERAIAIGDAGDSAAASIAALVNEVEATPHA
jgi:hypothetical protein